MVKNIALCMVLFSAQLFAAGRIWRGDFAELTKAMNHEARTQENPNITKETHPTLYNLVEDLCWPAQVNMPRYITLTAVEKMVIGDNGVAHKTAEGNIVAWVDMLGDLHICRAIVTELSYQEVKGIVAVALAEGKLQIM